MDTILAFFVALVARDPVSLSDLARHTPSTSLSPSTTSKQHTGIEPPSFVGILFHILESTFSDGDPLRLVTPNSTAEESEFKNAGIGKKDRLTVRSVLSFYLLYVLNHA